MNGPFTFSPDGNPLIGPIRGLPGYWTACGVMAGLSQSGGVGLSMANWITAGDPGFDVWAMDVARFGDHTHARLHQHEGARELLRAGSGSRSPTSSWPRGAGVQTSPIHDRLVEANAGVRRLVRAGDGRCGSRLRGLDPVEEVTFGRSNAWDRVRAETLGREGWGGSDGDHWLRQVPGGGARCQGVGSTGCWPGGSRYPVGWRSRR